MQGVDTRFQFDYEDESIIEGRGTGGLEGRDLGVLRLKRCLEAFAGLPAGAKVLEVGCGAGRQSRTLKKFRPELEVHGCDLSHRAIAEAQSYNDGVEYRVSDAAKLPYEDNSFEAVMLFDVLEHVPEPQSVVQEMARVLKPGGIFHGFIPIEGQPRTLFYRLRHSRNLPISKWKMERIGHIQQFTDTGIITLLEKHGLKFLSKSYSFHLMGQLLDIADYWQRDRSTRADLPDWRNKLVKLTARVIMFPTWRLAYYEDSWRAVSNKATGLHLTARKG